MRLFKVQKIFKHQADATISQAAPVSTTIYTVLATTPNVRIIGISAKVTWTVQPTPLAILVVIDGVTFVFTQANPVSTTPYYAQLDGNYPPANQGCTDNTTYSANKAFLLEGRSVGVGARTTGGTVSNLTCTVRYAKLV